MALLKDSERLMTGEELFHSPDLGPCELVDGRVVPMTPTGDEPADVESELLTRLRVYGKETGRGRAVGGEVGIYVRRNPDTVRAADVVFISRERDHRPRAKIGGPSYRYDGLDMDTTVRRIHRYRYDGPS